MNDASNPQLAGPQPMTIGRILDCIWAILRGNFALFLRLGAVPAAAMLVAYALIFAVLFATHLFPPNPHAVPSSAGVAALFAAILAAMIPMMLAYALFEAAACFAALQAKRGIPTTFAQAYSIAFGHAGRYIGLMILRSLCVVLPIVLIFGTVAAAVALPYVTHSAPVHPGILFLTFPLLVLAYAGALVYAVWMTLRLILAFPASINEDLTAVAALHRSAQLSRKAKGRMFLVFLVVYALGQAAFFLFEMAAGLVFALAMFASLGLHLNPHSVWLIVPGVLIGLCIFAAIFAWMGTVWASYAITFSVLYEDQLLRTGGLAPASPGGAFA